MKTICVLCDAEGNLCVRISTNPDLARRELAQMTGAAQLLWTSLAPGHMPAAEIVQRLEAVLPRLTPLVRSGPQPLRLYGILCWHAVLAPLLQLGVARLFAPWRKRFRRLAFRLSVWRAM